jgi:hypothetical protein
MLDDPFKSIGDVQDEKESLLAELANRAALDLEADAVILAGAPMRFSVSSGSHLALGTRQGTRVASG